MEKLVEIISKVLDSNSLPVPKNIDRSSHLRDDLGFDSFGLAELTVHIEEEFDKDVFSDGIVETVGEIEDKLNS